MPARKKATWGRKPKAKAFASKQEVREFVDSLLDHWESQGYSQEEVHERATQLFDDARNGVEIINEKPVYAIALGSILKKEGCFMTEASVQRTSASARVTEDSPYF